MVLLYEANPPRISSTCDADMERLLGRLVDVADVCGGIHITENVLGARRVSPLEVRRLLVDCNVEVPMTLTMRSRDRSIKDAVGFAQDAAKIGFEGMLVVAGDPAPGATGSGPDPSWMVDHLRKNSVSSKMELYLSISSSPNYDGMSAKLKAHPDGFITQVIQDESQVTSMVEALPEYKIIPILLYPSAGNRKAASFLGIKMSAYADKFERFVNTIHDMTGDVLLTSPGDYSGLYRFLINKNF